MVALYSQAARPCVCACVRESWRNAAAAAVTVEGAKEEGGGRSAILGCVCVCVDHRLVSDTLMEDLLLSQRS